MQFDEYYLIRRYLKYYDFITAYASHTRRYDSAKAMV